MMYTHLPAEILTDILDYSSTAELQRRLRLVSKFWNQLATAICRRRRVRFKNAKSYYYHSVCNAHTFSNPDNLPWSAIQFVFDRDIQSSTFTRTITESFGHQIQALKVSTITTPFYYEHIVLLLSRMPNLRELEIKNIFVSFLAPFHFLVNEQRGVVELPCLREFKIQISQRETIQLLEFVLERAPLTSLELDFTNFRAGNLEAEWMCSMLSNLHIKYVSVDIDYPTPKELWEVLAEAQQNFVIQNLAITSVAVNVSQEDLLCLGRFLAYCKGLQSLSFIGFIFAIKSPALLEIPPLPALEVFNVDCRDTAKPTASWRGFWFYQLGIQPLASCNFPSLEEVTVTLVVARYVLPKWVPRFYRRFGSGSFKSLKVLDVTNCSTGVENWARAACFHNLTKLAARISLGKDLATIFVNLYFLEELELTLHSKNKDVNVKLCTGFTEARSVLGKLTNLKMLHVTVEEGAQPCDTGAVLFTLLPPLHLTFSNCVSLSEGCVAQLRNHHLRFELTGEGGLD